MVGQLFHSGERNDIVSYVSGFADSLQKITQHRMIVISGFAGPKLTKFLSRWRIIAGVNASIGVAILKFVVEWQCKE